MSAVLTLLEHKAGVPEPTSLQALTLARGLAERLGLPLHTVQVEAPAEAATALGAYGASVVHVAEHEALDGYAPMAWARCVIDLVGSLSPVAVLAAGTDRCHEVLAHAAAELELPLVANATEIEPGEPGQPWLVTRQRWGGSLLEQAEVNAAVKLLSVAPHGVEAEEAAAPVEPSVEAFAPGLTESDLAVRVRERVEREAGGVSLAEAKVVVGGGRGVGGPEGFGPLEELAGLLGGAVGCSRVVTNAGWRPHADQIGQTGTRIAPDLYIACGISGATQHMVGVRGAKRVLAVNTDWDAPIIAHSDYVVLGDLHQVLPAIVEEVRRATGE